MIADVSPKARVKHTSYHKIPRKCGIYVKSPHLPKSAPLSLVSCAATTLHTWRVRLVDVVGYENTLSAT